MRISRRTLLNGLAAGSGLAAMQGWARLAFAGAPGDARLIVMILRGGLDGLAAVPAIGDPAYASARGALAIGEGAHRLDDTFALNPALKGFAEFWRKGELAVIHAIASPYRERSHFDAQNVLENGTARANGAEGWLNRALGTIAGKSARDALAIAQSVPLILQGEHQVSSWMPGVLPETDPDYLNRVMALYENDPALRSALDDALQIRAMAEDAAGAPLKGSGGMQAARGPYNLVPLAKAAGALIGKEGGPRIAVLEANGWDTHAGQGAGEGQLARRLGNLDEALTAFAGAMGPAWAKTAMLVVTEFGRTVAVNGTNGTDHGTGGAAFAMGGAIKGGQVVADWPSLSRGALHEGRDLKATADLRSLFKGALMATLGLDADVLSRTIFPDSADVKPLTSIFRV
ncbi:MAG: DUF1501 domain-containing protein [Alphaproteobacteria bacterium]|nr:DUF1501 domain-containing protein [Alphaproteobacteria bacterium]